MRMIIPSRVFSVLLVDIFLGILAFDTSCSIDDDCYEFQDLASWNQEYVSSLCIDDGNTDKSTNATLCEAYVGNLGYENSLKLAILNTMYGTGPTDTFGCGYYCMYDPLHIAGATAVSFKWSNTQSCWNVLVGSSSQFCHMFSVNEWMWAIQKTENWCCPSDPTPTPDPTLTPTNSPTPLSPAISPTPLPVGHPTIPPSLSPTSSPTNSMLCSADDDCYQFQDVALWNQEYVTSLCNEDGATDKSITATLCDAYVGDLDYENSLKLAILNTMYGTAPILSQCPSWCMYDPLNITGDTAVGFLWSSSETCWGVLVGAAHPLCYIAAIPEWEWSIYKTQNWCCPSDPTIAPTNSPPQPPGVYPTIQPSLPPTCSADDICYQFQDLGSWNQEYVTSLCNEDGATDKSTNATLCDAYVGDLDYENSLKLAILNTMYGPGPRPMMSPCAYWCMYDPLNIVGDEAVGFLWSSSEACWDVLVGADHPLCYAGASAEWIWAFSRTENWCCPSDPTPMPTNSPPQLPGVYPTIQPSLSPTLPPTNCSADDDCYQFQGLDSWNQEYVTSLCNEDGHTDKSTNATLCDAYVGDLEYENSLKLAILNTMYGAGPRPFFSSCAYWCMYDPLNIEGDEAVGFKWSSSEACWDVLLGAHHPLCYTGADAEWKWAISRTQNWCCS